MSLPTLLFTFIIHSSLFLTALVSFAHRLVDSRLHVQLVSCHGFSCFRPENDTAHSHLSSRCHLRPFIGCLCCRPTARGCQLVSESLAMPGAVLGPSPRGRKSWLTVRCRRSTETGCGPVTVTATVTEIVTSLPTSIAAALDDPAALSASLSSQIAAEYAYDTLESELLPPSYTVTATTYRVVTFTEVLPLVGATLTSVPANKTTRAAYFISVNRNTTVRLTDYTPPPGVVVGTTTITLTPLPSPVQSSPTDTFFTTFTVTETIYATHTSTIRSRTPFPAGGGLTAPRFPGWNATQTLVSLASDVTGSVSHPLMYSVTVQNSTTLAFAATNITGNPYFYNISTSPSEASGYGDGPDYGYGSDYTAATGLADELVKRQTCTLVFATINGDVVSWCNNWDGTSATAQTTFTTTCEIPVALVFESRYLLSCDSCQIRCGLRS